MDMDSTLDIFECKSPIRSIVAKLAKPRWRATLSTGISDNVNEVVDIYEKKKISTETKLLEVYFFLHSHLVGISELRKVLNSE